MTEPIELLREKLADRYRVEEQVESGLVDVYDGLDLERGTRVALWVLPFELPDAAAGGRFRRATEPLLRLPRHPNVLAPHAADIVRDRPFLVSAVLEGVDLLDYMRRGGGMGVRAAVDIAQQAAAGLAHLHQHGILHEDVNPRTILLSGDGVLLTNAGLPRILLAAQGLAGTEDGIAVGNPTYLAPEVIRGRDVDERTDLYGLGCVLFLLVTGRPPYQGSDVMEIVRGHLGDSVASARSVNPEVPAGVDGLIRRLLATEPAERIQSAIEVRDACAAILVGLPEADSKRRR